MNPLPFVTLLLFSEALSTTGHADGQTIYGEEEGVVKWGDQGNGTYRNPILPGDYQNTDVVRVNGDYYYISATKVLSPGMLVLHSKDLINWQPIGHVIPDITIFSPGLNYDHMDNPSGGIWAGAIVYHDNRFYVYFTTPNEGLYVTTASTPAGPWEPATCLMHEAGWDDPSPFWDGDGQAYLVTTHFNRESENGKTYNIHLFKMSADGKSLLRASDIIIHQSEGSEANKLLKIKDYYYHFYSDVTPEGRVPMIERAKVISGPYESRQLMHVTHSIDREPNQGTILDTGNGTWVLITHHGTSDWEGRPVSVLPVTWQDGWPVPGKLGSDGIGNMVWSGQKPISGFPTTLPEADDDFDGPTLAPQWEWFFQPRADKWSLSERPGYLRLHAFKPLKSDDLLKTGNILTERPFHLSHNTVTMTMDISHMVGGQTAGLCFLGRTFGSIAVAQDKETRGCIFNNNGIITLGSVLGLGIERIYLRAIWGTTGSATFQFSTDGKTFKSLGVPFQITNFGGLLGARLGMYTTNTLQDAGYVDIDSCLYSYDHYDP
jgi:beta-xylosidase